VAQSNAELGRMQRSKFVKLTNAWEIVGISMEPFDLVSHSVHHDGI
jgi:hypothetical protein